jgi:hypothetical protein
MNEEKAIQRNKLFIKILLPLIVYSIITSFIAILFLQRQNILTIIFALHGWAVTLAFIMGHLAYETYGEK